MIKLFSGLKAIQEGGEMEAPGERVCRAWEGSLVSVFL